MCYIKIHLPSIILQTTLIRLVKNMLKTLKTNLFPRHIGIVG